MRNRLGLVLLAVVTLAWPGMAKPQNTRVKGRMQKQSRVVFVCEHGAALSVVSAAYFNKLAREQHLNLHAVARGTAPQKDISVSARDGLKADGVSWETRQPRALSQKDAANAVRIVAFCSLPAKYSKMAPVETWNDVPPTGVNYVLARDAILRHIKELIGQLKPE